MMMTPGRLDPGGFAKAVLEGLASRPKRLSPKYLYDRRGSELFDRICEVPEYYPYRCELEILRAHGQEIAELTSRRGRWIEFGSGASRKTRLLLDHLAPGSAYVPVDLSSDFLDETARRLKALYPRLRIEPVCADFAAAGDWPAAMQRSMSQDAGLFFPGSTIGNFEPEQARQVLASARRLVGPRGALVVGVDLRKDKTVLEAAYNDAHGVTAAFNLNLLVRINRELGADFAPGAFSHRAFFNPTESRIEMHLVSRQRQLVRITDHVFAFDPGETIHTENSYKYGLGQFALLAQLSGLRVETTWTDSRGYFSVHVLRPQAEEGGLAA